MTFEVAPDGGSATTTVTVTTDSGGIATISYRGPQSARTDTVTAVFVSGQRDSLEGTLTGDLDPADLEDSVGIDWV